MDLPGNYPAFPCEAQGNRSVPPEHDYLQVGTHAAKFPGMTMRDAFAIAALPVAWDACDKGYFDGASSEIAACAYQMADAMLIERQKVASA